MASTKWRVVGRIQGNFPGELTDNDFFCLVIERLDGDQTQDLAVGLISPTTEGGAARGAVFVLFLRPDGSVG
jgi:hypothetical protein